MLLYVVIPPGSSATKMPLKILYRDVYYGYGAHRSVFKISKSSYLYRSVYHASLNFLRDRQRAHKLHEKWMKQTYESEVAAIAGAIEEEAISRFYQAISRLPEQQREILLQSANGKKIRDIALSLGISENTVKTQKKRAYFFLREQLGELWLFVLPLLFK